MCVCEPGESRNDDLQIDFQQLTLVLLFCRRFIAGFGLHFGGRIHAVSLENISNNVKLGREASVSAANDGNRIR